MFELCNSRRESAGFSFTGKTLPYIKTLGQDRRIFLSSTSMGCIYVL